MAGMKMSNPKIAIPLQWSARALIATALCFGLTACGGDDVAPPAVGGSGAMDAGGTGGVGADGGGVGAAGDGGTGGSAGVMDAGRDSARPDTDGGVEDAGKVVPAGWLCRGSLWSDSVCDCGCGQDDVDCPFGEGCIDPGCTANACEACFAVDGTWTPCTAAAWTCDPADLDDANDFCDCGCGAPDPDCRGRGCTGASCKAQACDRCHDESSNLVDCTAPIEWNCTPAAYGTGDGCDCGCGAPDPDCGGAGCTTGYCVDDACEVCRDNGQNIVSCALPEAWLCNPLAYGSGDGCDCACGVTDPDCEGAGCEGNACSDDSCDNCHSDTVSISCSVPNEWTCHPVFYDHNGVCDCGCGAPDPDCADAGCVGAGCEANGCEVCHSGNTAIAACGTPTCDPSHVGTADGCDCGCGVTDPDCLILPSCTEAGCDVDTCESCNTGDARTACGGWTCGLERYGDGHCDCGCGAADPDCDGNGCSARGCFAAACEQCRDSAGRPTSCDTGVCAPENIGSRDGCDCGCGVEDPDCAGKTSCTQPGCASDECRRCHDPLGRVIDCL